MREQCFRSILNTFIDILKKRIYNEYNNDFFIGRNAAIDRIISLISEKIDFFNDVYEQPTEKDFEYFFFDLFLNIKEDIAETKDRLKNSEDFFLLGFIQEEVVVLDILKQKYDEYI